MVEARRVLQNGYALREIRELKGWSGASLAAATGIAPGTLSNIESERRSTSARVLVRIAEVLQIPIEAIMRERCADGREGPAGAAPSS